MAEARTRSLRRRGRAAGLFAAGYVVALTTFWIAGIAVYAVLGHGIFRLAGLAYFPILLLPFLGHGNFWLWWFALQMILGAGAMWMYPYEPRRDRRSHPQRRVPSQPVGFPRRRSVARMPRI